jgi:aryl-alcohol dehydrogenase-like predicted oxidoreductase
MCYLRKISIGTAQFGSAYGVANKTGQVSKSAVRSILDLAMDHGIDTLDTAINYGNSEEVLGECGVEKFRIVTKLPGLPADVLDVEEWVTDQILGSLQRLRVPCVHAVLLHRTQDLLGKQNGDIALSLQKCKFLGLTEKIGLSIYESWELEQIADLNLFDIVQGPLNVLDRRLERSGWVDKLNQNGIDFHARSVFLQGLLLLSRSDIPEKFERWSELWNEWHRVISDANLSQLAGCLCYPLSIPNVKRVLVGVDSVSHFEEIVRVVSSNGTATVSLPEIEDRELLNPSFWNRL